MGVVNLVELFQSFQGEGPDAGKRVLITRFKRCNRSCSWCDTKVKMNSISEQEYSLSNIQYKLTMEKCGLLITGGEPTFDSPENDNFSQTITLLKSLRYSFANVETNGYQLWGLLKEIWGLDKRVKIIYSPKLFNQHDFLGALDRLQYVSNRMIYVKVVCPTNPSDFIINYLNELSQINTDRVFLMPEGITSDELIASSKQTLELANKYQFNFTSRDHIIHTFA